ncbi:MAG: penicillin-binding protein activator LpoB [Candidatus Omnitrophica bacterium]|nr:penicillin-binding protein activator LpoB [Candidatus Omnitrophota bacterium]
MNKLLLILVTAVILTGCTPKTVYVDKANDKGKVVLSLDYRDFDIAIREMTQSLLVSGRMRKPGGGKYVVTTAVIVNDTTQRIDTRQLMASVEEELLASGVVDMTSAIGSTGDGMISESRKLRDSDEFDPNTVQEKGQLIGPDLSFSGKIFERVVYYDKRTKQVEYYIELIVTDLKTGLRFWQKQVQILKRGGNKVPMW